MVNNQSLTDSKVILIGACENLSTIDSDNFILGIGSTLKGLLYLFRTRTDVFKGVTGDDTTEATETHLRQFLQHKEQIH